MLKGSYVKRTKEWWAGLNKGERSALVCLERAQHYYGSSPYYPDDCGECGGCGCPSLGGGLCNSCSNRLQELLNKASMVFISRKFPLPHPLHPYDVFPLVAEPIDSNAKIYTKDDLRIKE